MEFNNNERSWQWYLPVVVGSGVTENSGLSRIALVNEFVNSA